VGRRGGGGYLQSRVGSGVRGGISKKGATAWASGGGVTDIVTDSVAVALWDPVAYDAHGSGGMEGAGGAGGVGAGGGKKNEAVSHALRQLLAPFGCN
jgi:hypothetical protein